MCIKLYLAVWPYSVRVPCPDLSCVYMEGHRAVSLELNEPLVLCVHLWNICRYLSKHSFQSGQNFHFLCPNPDWRSSQLLHFPPFPTLLECYLKDVQYVGSAHSNNFHVNCQHWRPPGEMVCKCMLAHTHRWIQGSASPHWQKESSSTECLETEREHGWLKLISLNGRIN